MDLKIHCLGRGYNRCSEFEQGQALSCSLGVNLDLLLTLTLKILVKLVATHTSRTMRTHSYTSDLSVPARKLNRAHCLDRLPCQDSPICYIYILRAIPRFRQGEFQSFFSPIRFVSHDAVTVLENSPSPRRARAGKLPITPSCHRAGVSSCRTRRRGRASRGAPGPPAVCPFRRASR